MNTFGCCPLYRWAYSITYFWTKEIWQRKYHTNKADCSQHGRIPVPSHPWSDKIKQYHKQYNVQRYVLVLHENGTDNSNYQGRMPRFIPSKYWCHSYETNTPWFELSFHIFHFLFLRTGIFIWTVDWNLDYLNQFYLIRATASHIRNKTHSKIEFENFT